MKILVVGFSVTGYGDPNFPETLANLCLGEKATQDWTVDYISLGGLSVDALSFLISGILKSKKPNVLVLEIATSWFSLCHKDAKLAEHLVSRILTQARSIISNIFFLNLYRQDLDDNDIVVEAIYKASLTQLDTDQ